MITLTFNVLGLILAGVSIFIGLAAAMASSEGDNWVGVAYAVGIVVVSGLMYLIGVGAETEFSP